MMNLEFERKAAKALLKQIHAGNPEALDRLRHVHPVSLRDRRPDELKLADAQHVIAREYGFTSWPRLVEYFQEMERHCLGPRHNSPDVRVERLEQMVQGVMQRQQAGDPMLARRLAHFVPRFFGRPPAEILALPIREDEARLVVARDHRRGSWEELLARAGESRAYRSNSLWNDESSTAKRAWKAIDAHDVIALAALLDEHPELLTPTVIEREWRSTLVSHAVTAEYDAKSPAARAVTDLLASRGADVQRELDERLLGLPHDRTGRADRVRWYLQRGANPNWMPPNGFTVLEHAIANYRDAASVELIAERVQPRRALWIAAGLGDVAGVRSFIAGKGRLTREGRQHRPDLFAMNSLGGFAPNMDADDLEIMWEAFEIAGRNERWSAMDALLDAGLPLDHAPLGLPLLFVAVGNMLLPLVEYLISRGADLDREWPRSGSMRALARKRVASAHDLDSEAARRLLAICGAGSTGEIVAELDAKRQSPPPPDSRTVRALQLAADDAARQGQASVTTENILVGVLRVGDGVFAELFMGTGIDMAKLRRRIAARLLPDRDPLMGQELLPATDADTAVRVAAADADARHRESVSPAHLLWGVLSERTSPAARLLAEVRGGDAQVWTAIQERLLAWR